MAEIPGYDHLVGGFNKSLKAFGMKKDREWIGAIIYLLILLTVIGGGLSLIFGSPFSSKESSTGVATTASITAKDSNVALNNSGTVNQTIIGKKTEPYIEAKVILEPRKQSDGFYHTTYELTLWDGSETLAPTTFHSVFVKCLGTTNPRVQIRPSSALVNDIECLSKNPPPTEGVLFWF